MPIVVQCDSCGARFEAPERLAGAARACPACGATIAIPSSANAAVERPAPAKMAVMTCGGCGGRFAVRGARPARPPLCPKCGAALVAPGSSGAPQPTDAPAVAPGLLDAIDTAAASTSTAPGAPRFAYAVPAPLRPPAPRASYRAVWWIAGLGGGVVAVALVGIVVLSVARSSRPGAAPALGTGTPAVQPVPGGGVATPPASSALPAGWSAPTDEEGVRFARDIDARMKSGDYRALHEAFDWDALAESAVAGLALSGDARRGFLDGFRNSQRGSPGLAGQIAVLVAGGGSYRLLRVHEVEGQKRALFRMLGADGALNYHDLIVGRNLRGDLKVVDIHVFLSGEKLTATLRRSCLVLLSQAQPANAWERMTGTDMLVQKHLAEVTRFSAAVKSRDAGQIVAAFEQLPDALKREKSMLLPYLQAASQQGEADYLRAIERFRACYPADPALDMVLLDWHAIRNEMPELQACLERLDRALGGDPHISLMRAANYLGDGDLAKAREYAGAALKDDPQMSDAYVVLISVALKENKAEEAKDLLTTLHDKFEADLPRLRQTPFFVLIQASQIFADWSSERARSGPEKKPATKAN